MPLKKSAGNMYDWVTHTHSHLGGECPHKCSYCYVQRNRFGVHPRYQGNIRLIEKELDVDYGSGNTIFIEHMNDLFVSGINPEVIHKILEHCGKYPNNEYVFQTKNPGNAFINYREALPLKRVMMIGTTIESNRDYPAWSYAPKPLFRYEGIKMFSGDGYKTFITIEPIMDFDVEPFVQMIYEAKPQFVNIGADSKRCGLSEPTPTKVKEFIVELQKRGIVIKKKSNLARFL